MVLIEICYCKITGKTRDLPKIHHFIPLEPWEAKKIKGKKKRMKSVVEMTSSATDHGKAQSNRREQIKLVLDMSNEGPMFKMLENMLGSAGSSMVRTAFLLQLQYFQKVSFLLLGSKCFEKITQIWYTWLGRFPVWWSRWFCQNVR